MGAVYAAVEPAKLCAAGVPYVARLLGTDPKTIRPGEAELSDDFLPKWNYGLLPQT